MRTYLLNIVITIVSRVCECPLFFFFFSHHQCPHGVEVAWLFGRGMPC